MGRSYKLTNLTTYNSLATNSEQPIYRLETLDGKGKGKHGYSNTYRTLDISDTRSSESMYIIRDGLPVSKNVRYYSFILYQTLSLQTHYIHIASALARFALSVSLETTTVSGNLKKFF